MASEQQRVSTPAPPHNRLYDGAPERCMCVECCRKVLDLRCPAVGKLGRCGSYKGHRGEHPLVVATTFVIAEERARLDG